MNRVPERATVDEKTIQKVAADELEPLPKKARKRTGKQSSSKVTRVQVVPAVWQMAQEIKRTGYTEIQVISETEVLVR